ncbi:MAG TPA: hypothetical protein VMD74_04545 [Candidatus Methylomirabilis sp.]|nr:hypothetical protein [Candidatus Methylomirabilis sp.]
MKTKLLTLSSLPLIVLFTLFSYFSSPPPISFPNPATAFSLTAASETSPDSAISADQKNIENEPEKKTFRASSGQQPKPEDNFRTNERKKMMEDFLKNRREKPFV